MYIKNLLEGIDYKVIQGSADSEIEAIGWDSRNVKPKSLFICVKGKNVDRHDYALDAIKAGATALVIQHEIVNIPSGIDVLYVNDSRASMAKIAATYFGHPSQYFNLIGITGTNGKTSVSWFIAKILEVAGRKTGIIGTIDNKIGNSKISIDKLNPTTPDSIELQGIFKEMLNQGVTDVAMEVTSTALVNNRVDYSNFKIGVFTNLTQDHLDEHGTMENYKTAKMRLFDMCEHSVINADDPIYEDIINNTKSENIISYGIERDAYFKAEDIEFHFDGVSFTLNVNKMKKNVWLKVPGKFSVYNALAAIAACYISGLAIDEIIKGIGEIEGVRGRFEIVPNPKGCLVIVDYAHTPDGLSNILSSVKEFARGDIISVFGCGGDREKTKRPIMGKIAGQWSNISILTSDNPRTENPSKILDDIEVGIKETICVYEKIENRKEAIYRALDLAKANDVIIIAGKGHETYQVFQDKTIHFDDTEVVKEYFEQ